MIKDDRMKRRRAIAYLVGFFLLCAGYAGLCLQKYWRKMPLDFSEDIKAEERKAIEEWYRTSGDVLLPPFELRSVVRSLSRPWSLDSYHPSVARGGIFGDGTIQVSGCHAIVIFHDPDDLTTKSAVRTLY